MSDYSEWEEQATEPVEIEIVLELTDEEKDDLLEGLLAAAYASLQANTRGGL